MQDGSFANRIPTSHERLLENLIGKKAAKAHLASRHKLAATAKPQKPVAPAPTKEESDEEEGRAASFKSKRQKRTVKPVPKQDESDDEDEESRAISVRLKEVGPGEQSTLSGAMEETMASEPENELVKFQAAVVPKNTSASRPVKAKPKSYLDEILGEKANKKSKKKKRPKSGGERTKD